MRDAEQLKDVISIISSTEFDIKVRQVQAMYTLLSDDTSLISKEPMQEGV